jgi:hypothetical protein
MSEDTEIFYNGKKVLKEHFRAFLYGANSTRILAHNYAEFQRLLATGVWFIEKDQIPNTENPKAEIEDKPRRKRGK